jgi:hypothetical protein
VERHHVGIDLDRHGSVTFDIGPDGDVGFRSQSEGPCSAGVRLAAQRPDEVGRVDAQRGGDADDVVERHVALAALDRADVDRSAH